MPANISALVWPRRRDIVVGLTSLVVLIAVCDALLYFSGHALVTPFQLESYTTAAAEGWLAAMWIAPVVVAPAGEEIMFRGFLFRGWVRSDRYAWVAIAAISLRLDGTARSVRLDRHGADIRRRPVSRLDALAQRLDAC